MNDRIKPDKNEDISVQEQAPAGNFSAEPPRQTAEAAGSASEDNNNERGGEAKGLNTAAEGGETGAAAVDREKEQMGDKGQSARKSSAPKVSPSTIVLTCVFALIFCAAAYFFPYIEALLPWGGSTIKGGLSVEEYNYGQLISEAHSVVVGEVGEKRDNIIQYRPTADGLNYIIYSEVDIKVEEVLYGEPDMDEDGVLVTYELGGRQEISENGRPKIIKVVYDDAAELASGERVILFWTTRTTFLEKSTEFTASITIIIIMMTARRCMPWRIYAVI